MQLFQSKRQRRQNVTSADKRSGAGNVALPVSLSELRERGTEEEGGRREGEREKLYWIHSN